MFPKFHLHNYATDDYRKCIIITNDSIGKKLGCLIFAEWKTSGDQKMRFFIFIIMRCTFGIV